MNTLTTNHHDRSSRVRALREGALVLTVLACVPYLALKLAWVFGSQIGIPAGSVLLEHESTMRIANGVSILMVATAVGLAFALARPRGRHVPAWLIAGPMWIATGLLVPILVAFPVQLALGSMSGGSAPPDFLEPWVFTAVYGGFMLQALGLGVLLVLHATSRWGQLWRGAVAELPALPTSSAMRFSVSCAGIVAIVPFVMHVAWASGATWLRASGVGSPLVDGLNAAFVLLAFAGAVVLVRGRARLDVRVPLIAAWVGSSVLGAWGAWMLFSAGLTGPVGQDQAPAGLVATFACATIAGAILLVTGAHLFAGWADLRNAPVAAERG